MLYPLHSRLQKGRFVDLSSLLIHYVDDLPASLGEGIGDKAAVAAEEKAFGAEDGCWLASAEGHKLVETLLKLRRLHVKRIPAFSVASQLLAEPHIFDSRFRKSPLESLLAKLGMLLGDGKTTHVHHEGYPMLAKDLNQGFDRPGGVTHRVHNSGPLGLQ